MMPTDPIANLIIGQATFAFCTMKTFLNAIRLLDHSRIFMQVGRLITPRRFAEGKPATLAGGKHESQIIAPRFDIVFTPLAHDQHLFITNFMFCRRQTRIAGFQSKYPARKVVDQPTQIQRGLRRQGMLPPDNFHSCQVVHTIGVERRPILFLSWETMSDQGSICRLLLRFHGRSVWPACRK